MGIETVFIFGAGYSARAFAQADRGGARRILGTTRDAAKFGILERSGMRPVLFDGCSLSHDARAALQETTHLIVSIAPGKTGDPVLEILDGNLRGTMPKLEWIGYLSTVGVYGDHEGTWVDETSACLPTGRSLARLHAEEGWRAIGEAAGVPVALLRLSGIYGPGRNAFVSLTNGTARRVIRHGQVFNRIHVADIAGATWLLARMRQGGVFNVSDDEPSPPQDLVVHAAMLMGIEPPPEEPFETADLSPMTRSFYGEVKRVSNAALKKAGYRFQYPDYRTAHDAMWRGGSWQLSQPRT